MTHYVYRVEHIETGEYYVGSRSCKVHPSMDNYKGSMRTWKVDKAFLRKEILADQFPTREECIAYERKLILEYIKDPLNRNYHIPGDGYHTVGSLPVVDLESGKVIRVPKDVYLTNLDRYKPVWKGKKHSKEARERMRQAALTRSIDEINELNRRSKISSTLKGYKHSEDFKRNLSESRKGKGNPMYGKPSPQKGKVYEQVVCPHCGKTIATTKANLFHFDKCKNKN